MGAVIRRLHDMGKSGWLSLLGLIPIVDAIFLLVILGAPSVNTVPVVGKATIPGKTEEVEKDDTQIQKIKEIAGALQNERKKSEVSENTKDVLVIVVILFMIAGVGLLISFVSSQSKIQQIFNSNSWPTITDTRTPARWPVPSRTSTITPNPLFTPTVMLRLTYHISTSTYEIADPWRVAPPNYATFEAADYETNAEWDDIIAIHIRNLAVKEPYYWEFFSLPRGTRYTDITNYYTPRITNLDYRIAQNIDDGTGIFLLSFAKGSGSSLSKILIQFWAETPEYIPLILVIYQNP